MTDDADDVTVAGQRALVLGASGNVGACVTRHLAAGGADVRVVLRKTSSTKGIDGLDVDRRYGDLFDPATVAAAMADRDVVYYCIIDTRAELSDPAPLFATNVDGLRTVLDVAAGMPLQRFVFLSTIGTIAVGADGQIVDEDTPFDWADKAGSYIESRRRAEDLVMSFVRERHLPAVVVNVSNHYGPPDWQPRQGMFVQMAALGKMPFYVRGVGRRDRRPPLRCRCADQPAERQTARVDLAGQPRQGHAGIGLAPCAHRGRHPARGRELRERGRAGVTRHRSKTARGAGGSARIAGRTNVST